MSTQSSNQNLPVLVWGQAGDKRSASSTMLISADAQLLNQQADDAIQSAEDAKNLCPLAYSRNLQDPRSMDPDKTLVSSNSSNLGVC